MWLLLLTVFTILSKYLTKKKQTLWLADGGMNMYTGESRHELEQFSYAVCEGIA